MTDAEDLIRRLGDSEAFENALEAVAEFRRIDPDMTLKSVSAFLAVVAHFAAYHEWPKIMDVARVLEVSQQAASRAADALGESSRGAGLIRKQADTGDARAVRLALSPQGEALLLRIAPLIG